MTREEAIKIVKEFINGTCLHLMDQEALETLIPELRESEDERIRKKIIGCLRLKKEEGKEFFGSEPIDNCIAYLEKQKEQKSAEVDERMKNDKHFLSICQHLGTLISESKNDEAIESIDKDYRWLCEFYRKSRSASVEENYKEPAEWSEEDEKIINWAIETLEHENYCTLAERLKSLKPQPKQEWSEEDENARQNLIAHFEGKVLRLSNEAKKEAVDWLKSLRPSWKPSEVCYGVKGDPDPAGTSDLEEAAEELFETIEIQEHENIFEDTFRKIFIAGAEWQKEQDAARRK